MEQVVDISPNIDKELDEAIQLLDQIADQQLLPPPEPLTVQAILQAPFPIDGLAEHIVDVIGFDDEQLDDIMHLLDVAPEDQFPPPPEPQALPIVPQHANYSPEELEVLMDLAGWNTDSDYNADSDDDMDQNLPWRNPQDFPSFQLMNIMNNYPRQPDQIEYNILYIENSSYLSLQDDTPITPNLNNSLSEQ